MTRAHALAVPDEQDDVEHVDLARCLAVVREELLALSRGRRADLAALTLLVPGPADRLRPAIEAMLRAGGFPELELRLVSGAALVLVAAEFVRIMPSASEGGPR